MPQANGHDPAASGAETARAICARYENRPDALIEVLIDLQHAKGCVSDAAVACIADALNLSRAEVHGARSFYTDFSVTPKGRCVVKLCRAEACQAVGAHRLAHDVESRLNTGLGTTRSDGAVSVEPVYCLGNCALGPSAMVGERLIGRADADKIVTAVESELHE